MTFKKERFARSGDIFVSIIFVFDKMGVNSLKGTLRVLGNIVNL